MLLGFPLGFSKFRIVESRNTQNRFSGSHLCLEVKVLLLCNLYNIFLLLFIAYIILLYAQVIPLFNIILQQIYIYCDCPLLFKLLATNPASKTRRAAYFAAYFRLDDCLPFCYVLLWKSSNLTLRHREAFRALLHEIPRLLCAIMSFFCSLCVHLLNSQTFMYGGATDCMGV